MQKFKLSLVSFLLMASQAKAGSYSERIAYATKLLSEVTENSASYQVKPNSSAKEMLFELGLQLESFSTKEDFEELFKTDSNEAWEFDSSSWGEESIDGAKSYVDFNLKQRFVEGEQTDANKTKYADHVLISDRAFEILKNVRTVKFGISPTGAVQCGIQFAALLILDLETGKIYEIIMEPFSGC